MPSDTLILISCLARSPDCFNLALFAGLAALGVWWAYPLLSLLPLVTWMMVIPLIRKIAESCSRARTAIVAQHAYHARGLYRMAVHPALLCQLSSRTPFDVLRPLLHSAPPP